jgi:DNA-binding CsgD family transcriptional regulator
MTLDPANAKMLDSIIAAAKLGQGTSVELKHHQEGTSYRVQSLPLGHIATRGPLTPKDHSSNIMLIITDPSEKLRGVENELVNRYRVAPSEMRVWRSLVEGDSVEAIAQRFGVGLRTVRSQVRSLLLKTDLGKQKDLVALYLRYKK